VSEEHLRSIRARIQALADVGRDAEVAALARQGLVLAPDDAWLLGELALALRSTDPKGALDAAARAAVAAPDDERAHRVAAWVHLASNHRKAAVRHAERAVALAPHEPAAYLTLATAKSASGDHREASAACDEVIRLAPAWPAGWVERSRQCLRARDWPAAEQWARRALALSADDPAALNNLAVALERQGRRGEALQLFATAAAADPRRDDVAENARMTARGLGAFGLGTIGVVLLVQVARAIVTLGGAAGVVFVVAAGVAALVIRARRARRELAKLPPHLQAFALAERRRRWRPDTRRDRIGLLVLVGLVGLAVVLTALNPPEETSDPERPDWSQLTVPTSLPG
jgi:tetratricopeptide (TPR) repeat protein